MIEFIITFGITLALIIAAYSQWDHLETYVMNRVERMGNGYPIHDWIEDRVLDIGEALEDARDSISPFAALKTKAFIWAYSLSAIIALIITLLL